MHSLPVFLRLEGRPVILIGEGEGADAKRRLLERAGARIVSEKGEAALAIVATDQPDAVVSRLRARGVLVNAVDRPDLCDFTLPAIVDRDPVLIAIGTGGASAGLAKALRQRLETIVPARLGALARALHAARDAIRRRWPDPAGRRRAIDAALAPGAVLDPCAEHDDDAVARWASARPSSDPAPGPSTGYTTIRLRSSDPDDLTLREARLLGSADRIYHRPDVPPAILDRGRADAARIACESAPEAIAHSVSIDLGWERG
jgi:uroporphyrin-III C-methyltransferase/precorrin-2 dehydrogenase/sirohydrochlorin ferrochelatase